jgi:hypothetical protein
MMMNISPELIFGVIVAGVVCLSIFEKLIPKNQPKERTFICTRCKLVSPHNQRTIEAWRNNKTTFFCQACHTKWLQSRPPQQRERNSYSGGSGSKSGCLGVIVLFAVVPLVGYLLVRVYA